jgi:hypothetical protein
VERLLSGCLVASDSGGSSDTMANVCAVSCIADSGGSHANSVISYMVAACRCCRHF